MSKQESKPCIAGTCLHCGSENSTIISKLTGHRVECNQCRSMGPERPTEAEAIAAWNRRYVKKCTWTLEDEDYGTYKTNCGHMFTLLEYGPKENKMEFCCYCGGELVEEAGK